MHERAGELDQAFVKVVGRLPAVGQPHFFEDIMGFVKEAFVEAGKIAEVMRVAGLSAEALDHRGDTCAFLAHFSRAKVKPITPATATAPPSTERTDGRSPSRRHENGMIMSGVSATMGRTMAVRSTPSAH